MCLKPDAIFLRKDKMISSRGKLIPYLVKPESTAAWSPADYGRAATLEARLQREGLSEAERRALIPCLVWSAKVPGLVYKKGMEAKMGEFRGL
jgi:hypothetical protein